MQRKSELLEQDGQVRFWTAYGTQTDFAAGVGGQDDVQRSDLGRLFEESPGHIARAAAAHPLPKGSPHGPCQKAIEDVGLGAVLPVMAVWAQPQVMLADTEAVCDLCQSDVDLPEGGDPSGHLRAQQTILLYRSSKMGRFNKSSTAIFG